ncbi:MAG: M28 family peptidase [Bryobacterales bacterium]|nr:M28 family peptidase [Bryobacterales bacterium]
MIKTFLLCIVSAASLHGESKAAKRWWSHVEFLADDKLQGRETGSEGHKTAARYVAAEFERAGLKPVGSNGYLQPVKLRSQRIDESASSIEIQVNGEWQKLTLGTDAYFSLRADLAEELELAAVFAGYGFTVPERDFDEFRGLDVKGKLVVYLTGGPKDLPAALMSHYQSADERWKRMKALGAVGIATISNPRTSELPWARASAARLMPSMRLSDLPVDRPRMNFAIHPERTADRFFAGTGHTMQELLELVAAGKPLPKFDLKVRVRTRTKLVNTELESDNVAGILQGRHPERKNEYLVISAHLDHVGTARAVGAADTVFNGAMDNASGIASLIEIARVLRKKPTERSVLFVAVTGEEKGLLGSQHMVHAPPVPKGAIIGDLNFDMFLPLFPLKRLIVYGMDESTMGDTARQAIEKHGLVAMRDPQPSRNSFIRSDQYSFIRRGIPALAFKFGYVPGSAEEKTFQGWLKERYHALSDDLSQPVDREAAAQFNRVMAEIAIAIGNEPQRPEWTAESIFRRYTE